MSLKYLLILLFCSMNGFTFGSEIRYNDFNCTWQSGVNVNIYGAFRLHDFIGIIAELTTDGKQGQLFPNKGNFYRSVFHFLWYGIEHDKAVPHASRYPYYDFDQFQEKIFLGLDQTTTLPEEDTQTTDTKNLKLMTAFDTSDIKVFDNQIVSQIVFFNDSNGVTAYELRVQRLEKGRINVEPLKEKLVVVHPEKHRYEDNSLQLNLAYLYIHFPLPDMYIDAIVIVEKPDVMYYNISRGLKEYIALVYTRTYGPKRQLIQFRHRMVGTNRTKELGIIWTFDPIQDFCDLLDIGDRMIQGVVSLNRMHPKLPLKDGTLQESKTEDMYIMEISTTEHRFIKMRYNMSTRLLDISPTTLNPDYSANQWISNNLFYNCTPDPYHWSNKRKPCPSHDPQYLYDGVPGVEREVPDRGEKSEDNNNWFSTTDYFLLFASIVVIIIIVVVLAFGVYFMTTRPKN